MINFDGIAELLKQDRPGFTLPQKLYVSEEAYRFDVDVMLKSVWLYACTVAHVKNPGDWFLFELGETSVIVVRGRDPQSVAAGVAAVEALLVELRAARDAQ